MFKSKIKFKKSELEKMIKWINEYIDYRGGMGNRIDAFDIRRKLEWKLLYIKKESG